MVTKIRFFTSAFASVQGKFSTKSASKLLINRILEGGVRGLGVYRFTGLEVFRKIVDNVGVLSIVKHLKII